VVIVGWILLISLITPVSIAQDEVEPSTCTVSSVVFKASEPEVFSLLNGLSQPVLAWKYYCFIATTKPTLFYQWLIKLCLKA
jgi:hypothetical protein